MTIDKLNKRLSAKLRECVKRRVEAEDIEEYIGVTYLDGYIQGIEYA